MFLPWGAVFSVDSAWQDEPPTASEYVSIGSAGYVIQIVCVYLFSAILKSGAEWWTQGSAIYYALNIDYLATPLGKALQELPYRLIKVMTWSVLLLEICAPLLLLYPGKTKWVRWAGALGIVALHLSISSVLFVGIFPIIGITAMSFFLPSEFWCYLSRKFNLSSMSGVKIYYDEDCGFCLRTVRVLKTLFVLPNVESKAAQTIPEIEREMRERNSWVVLDSQGKRHFGYDGVLIVAGASPIWRHFLPLLTLGFVQWCGEHLYRYVALHRRLSCELPNRQVDVFERSPRLRLVVNGVLIFLIMYVLILNLATIKPLRLRIPDRAEALSIGVGLDQNWNMFAPFPAKDDGWYVIPGKLQNGAVVDLFRSGRPVSFAKPSYGSFEFKNHRWVKFSENLRNRPFLQPVYAQYLCRAWNQRHKGAQHLEELEIIYVLEWTQAPPEYSPIEKQSKFKFQCDR
jgi:predicted DCC family thiol-disulfide oxidoreductase YuxK